MATMQPGRHTFNEVITPTDTKATPRANPYIAFAGVVGIWIAFFALMAFWPGTLENMWTTFLDYQLAVRVILGTLLLPWTLATWVWHSDWAVALQAVTIGAIVLATLIIFRPAGRA